MGQVIEARIFNPETSDVLIDEIIVTSAPYNPTDQTGTHLQAIEFALKASGCTLKSAQRISGPALAGTGNNACWQYAYDCTLAVPDEIDRAALAVLFAQYKELE